MSRIKKDWWKGFFNEVYLITDSGSVCNDVLTSREVNILEKLLGLDRNTKILDLCGGHGRHSIELAKRGYKNLTVLDYSSYLTNLGKRLSKEKALRIKFLKRDARFTGLKSESYQAIFIMANSFGYFPDEKENLRILKEIYRLLNDGGKLLVDLADGNYVKNNLKPISWHEANKDIVVCRKRSLKGSIIKARELVISRKNGLVRDGFYCERIYTKEKIKTILKRAGFCNVSIKEGLSLHKNPRDYGLMTSRIFACAQKSKKG